MKVWPGKNSSMFKGNMIHVKFWIIVEIIVIIVILSTTQTIAPIQATRDFAGEANIHAVNSVGTFTSETSSVRYIVDPSTKKGYYFIGTAYPEFENTTTDESTVENGTDMIRSTSYVANVTSTIKARPSQPSLSVNKTISSAYLELFPVLNDFSEIEPPQSLADINRTISDAYIELFILINEKAKLPPTTATSNPGRNILHRESPYYPQDRSGSESRLDSTEMLKKLGVAMGSRR